MHSLSCELIIYVNCKQDFAYGSCIIIVEAVHANERIYKVVAQLKTQLISRSGYSNSYDLKNAGLGHLQYAFNLGL